MLREIILDTETTGLDPDKGHRVIEIACVELVNHLPTHETFHRYINPERDVPEDAVRIHGLTGEFLAEHPVFKEVTADFLEFIGDSRLVIHNAAFDMRFLNAELARLKKPALPQDRALDTLTMAQRKFVGASNSLDALCRRFGIDNSSRGLHSALLDCQLLAQVYLELIGGRQTGFDLAPPTRQAAARGEISRPARPPRPHAASPEELTAHAALLKQLTDPVWNQ